MNVASIVSGSVPMSRTARPALVIPRGPKNQGPRWWNVVAPGRINTSLNGLHQSQEGHFGSVGHGYDVQNTSAFQPGLKRRPANILIPSPNPELRGIEACNSAMPLIMTEDAEYSSPISIRQAPQDVSASGGAPHGAATNQVTGSFPDTRIGSRSPQSSYHTAWRCERKLLIIGAGHDASIYLGSTRLSRLSGVINDRNNLTLAFQPRGYSVQTMVKEDFDRGQLLQRVRDFLSTAVAGDVRAIVFTGHAVRAANSDREEVAIVPKRCFSTAEAIPASLWNSTLREHTRPGVVVLSIFATCMSGGILEQGVNLACFHQLKQRPHTRSPDAPTIIAFSSSSAREISYELPAPTLSPPNNADWHDTFLWALARTIRRRDVQDWETFVETLQNVFTDVRAAAAPLIDPWNSWHDHRQTPHIASTQNPMPDFHHVLPPLP